MRALESFPMEMGSEDKDSPIAIMSGDLIHIVYPNGDVDLMTHQQLEDDLTPTPFESCKVWGYFEEF